MSKGGVLSPKQTNRFPEDVLRILEQNKQMVKQFEDQVKKLEEDLQHHGLLGKTIHCLTGNQSNRKVVQRRKEKTEDLKPKTAYFQQETTSVCLKKNFNMLNAQRLSVNHEYWQQSSTPASCVGFSMTFCPAVNKAYVYGGISCNNSLENGLKTYFYEFDINLRKWKEVQQKSGYSPMTRYGCTLNCYNRQLILFGGVSEFKAKLRDRCYYSEVSLYDIIKAQWRIFQTFSSDMRPRRNHAACLYQSYFVVYGGQNTNEDILDEIIIINLESKKPRWRSFKVPGRVNHQLVYVPNLTGGNKQYLYSFGGLRYRQSIQQTQQIEVSNDIMIFPIMFQDGHLVLRQNTVVRTNFSPRQCCIFCRFDQGILIIGGRNQKKQTLKECQYLSVQSLSLKPIKIDVAWDQMKQPQGVTISPEQVLIFGGNQHTYLLQK